jgi:hypothetical protein
VSFPGTHNQKIRIFMPNTDEPVSKPGFTRTPGNSGYSAVFPLNTGQLLQNPAFCNRF